MRSGFERTLAVSLKRRKAKFTYETLKLPYVIEHSYRPDFILDNGIIVEAKGYFRPGECAKMIAVKKAHPTLDIRFVFGDAKKPVRKGAKLTHGEWATKHGFPYADGQIPDEWL
jgi:Autographiviridae endonuclease I